MKTIITLVSSDTLENFADKHGLVMLVNERIPANLGGRWDESLRFYAHFDDAEVKKGGFLSATHGNGASVEEAIESYMAAISEQLLVVNAYGGIHRKEIRMPRFTSVR